MISGCGWRGTCTEWGSGKKGGSQVSRWEDLELQEANPRGLKVWGKWGHRIESFPCKSHLRRKSPELELSCEEPGRVPYMHSVGWSIHFSSSPQIPWKPPWKFLPFPSEASWLHVSETCKFLHSLSCLVGAVIAEPMLIRGRSASCILHNIFRSSREMATLKFSLNQEDGASYKSTVDLLRVPPGFKPESGSAIY